MVVTGSYVFSDYTTKDRSHDIGVEAWTGLVLSEHCIVFDLNCPDRCAEETM